MIHIFNILLLFTWSRNLQCYWHLKFSSVQGDAIRKSWKGGISNTFGNTGNNNIIDSNNFLRKISRSSRIFSTIKDSVHLQLNKLDKTGKENMKVSNQNESNQTTNINSTNLQQVSRLYEYVTNDDNSTIVLACLDSSKAGLDSFWFHRFNSNITESNEYIFRNRTIDLQDKTQIKTLQSLWKSECLLSKSEYFPFSQSIKSKRTFKECMQSSVNRMKLLYSDIYNTTTSSSQVEITEFLMNQNINGKFANSFYFSKDLSLNDSIHVIKEFATWFRGVFPYYYDKCQHCDHSGSNEFAGILHPSSSEGLHQARVTETYLCQRCHRLSRFPRYNSVAKVVSTKMGRCGEYSVLMLRMLNTLGYRTRWVVDIADHVWTEVFIEDKWIHVDPCEAAVNEPLIYQSWGKNQTYIIAFDYETGRAHDVTNTYTSNSDAAASRRLEDNMNDEYFEEIMKISSDELSNYLYTNFQRF